MRCFDFTADRLARVAALSRQVIPQNWRSTLNAGATWRLLRQITAFDKHGSIHPCELTSVDAREVHAR